MAVLEFGPEECLLRTPRALVGWSSISPSVNPGGEFSRINSRIYRNSNEMVEIRTKLSSHITGSVAVLERLVPIRLFIMDLNSRNNVLVSVLL